MHFSGVICMRPCSPAPPTAFGVQLLSCIANDASKISGTNRHSNQPKWPQVTAFRRRTSVFLSVLFESSNGLVTARGECCMPCAVQRDDYKLVNPNGSRRPTGTMEAAIQPVDVAIRATHRRDLSCKQNNKTCQRQDDKPIRSTYTSRQWGCIDHGWRVGLRRGALTWCSNANSARGGCHAREEDRHATRMLQRRWR